MQPTQMCTGNAYEEADASPIPMDISEAIALMRGSDFLKDVLGEHLHEIYCQQSEREVGFIANQVTPVETQRYITNF